MAQTDRETARFLIRLSSLMWQYEVYSEYPPAQVGPMDSTAMTPVGVSPPAGWKCRTLELTSEGTFLSQT
jgi:hypothetical protein